MPEYTLTDQDIKALDIEWAKLLLFSAISKEQYSSTIERTLEKLKTVKAETRDKAFEKAWVMISQTMKLIYAAEDKRKALLNPTWLNRVLKNTKFIEVGVRDEPEFKVDKRVEIVNSKDAEDIGGVDPYKGHEGKIISMKFLGNNWVYSILLDGEFIPIYRHSSNLKKPRRKKL